MKAYVYLFTVLSFVTVGTLGVAAEFAQVWEANRVTDSLLSQQTATTHRAEVKQQIVDDVIDDRLTLAQAADRFGEWNAKAPETMTAVRMSFSGASDKERLCRQVIQRVEIALQDRTSEDETVIPRLEREMHELLGDSTPKN